MIQFDVLHTHSRSSHYFDLPKVLDVFSDPRVHVYKPTRVNNTSFIQGGLGSRWAMLVSSLSKQNFKMSSNTTSTLPFLVWHGFGVIVFLWHATDDSQ